MIQAQLSAQETPDDAGAFDADAAEDAWLQGVLREMAELDLMLLRALTHQAAAQAEAGEPAGEAALAASRVGRSLRLTLSLKERFAKARRARLDEIAVEEIVAEAEEQHAATRRHMRGLFRKHKVMRIVEEAIGEEAEGERAERLSRALAERMEGPEVEAEYFERPYGELAARICQDLGLSPDWSQWEDEKWAKEEAENRERSGSPFAPPGWGVRLEDVGLGCGPPVPPDDRLCEPRSSSP